MNRDFEDEVGRSRARSRRKPAAKEGKETRKRPVPDEARRSVYREQASDDMRTGGRRTAARTGERDLPEDDGLKLWNETGSSQRDTGRNQRDMGRSQREAGGGRQSGKRVYQESPASSRVKARSEKTKKKRRIITMIIAECFALAFIFGYAFVARKLALIQRADDFKAEAVKSDLTIDTLEKMEGYWTIALFGVDSRGTNVEKGTNADVNIICNINEDTGEIRLVSVFRDSYLNIDDSGTYNKINQAYFRGGPTQAVKALNKNLDLDITDYVTFNWKAVAEGINLLGGVDIELSKAEFHYINSFITETAKVTGLPTQHLKHAGMNHLDGVQAVAYGRLRLMDTDYARTERQRKIIAQAFEKAKKADIGTLNQIVEVVFPNVSSSMRPQDFIRMAQKISKYHIGETGGFPFARGDANLGKKGACVIPQTLESNVKELHKFLFEDDNYIPTDSVKKISAKISADSGMYNKGKSVGHVSTEGGIISKPKSTEDTEKTTKSTEETKEKETIEHGIDLDGDGIPDVDINDEEFWDDPDNWPTDAEGNPVHPSTEPSSADGTKPTKPGESESMKPTKPGETESTKATKPGETESSKPTKPTKPDSTSPTKPTPHETKAEEPTSKPNEVVPSQDPGSSAGPGGPGQEATQPNPQGGPGGGGTDNQTTVAPPPVMDGSGNSAGPGGGPGEA